MTHFNHEWDTTKTPAVPVSVGDRYYAQDLNDDFNYLKHLPYEVFLQGRSCGVMIAPSDTYNNSGNGTLALSGGFGVILQDCIEADPDENFVIPPKTHSSPRYERIPFVNTELAFPRDGAVHYIVATPTKRSLLQRTKAIFAEQYASRVRYDGVITIQNTAPTTNQILVGLCHDREYCLFTDNDINQCKDSIILKKWYAKNTVHQETYTAIQTCYNTTLPIQTNIEADLSLANDSIFNINAQFYKCNITINNIANPATSGSGSRFNRGFNSGIFRKCKIHILTLGSSMGIGTNNYAVAFNAGEYHDCEIIIDTVQEPSTASIDTAIIRGGTFRRCTFDVLSAGSGTSLLVNGVNKNVVLCCGKSTGSLDVTLSSEITGKIFIWNSVDLLS